MHTYAYTETDSEVWQPVSGPFVKCFQGPLFPSPVLTIRNPKATVKIHPADTP